MSHSTAPGNGSPVWRIERFELIFYNARHRRWQYFIEDPGQSATAGARSPSEASVHRQQMPRLLSTLRRVISDAVSTEASIQIPPLGHSPTIVIKQPDFKDWSHRKNAYLDYLLYTATSEGLDDDVMMALSTLTAKLKSGESVIPVEGHVAHALLSLLPIKEEWDTWGCFVRARQGNETSGLPPTQPGTRWFQPFYLAELTYNKNSTNPHATSVRLLGEEVTLQAGCRDLSRPSDMEFVVQRDFYDYCHRPDAGTKHDDDELFLYRCYGHFVDTLIKALLTPASTGGDTAAESRRIFVIAYPVQVAGRLHFFQVALTTADRTVSLKTLSETWVRINAAFWVPECVSMLESALERVSLSAFQLAVEEQLRRYSLEQLKKSDRLLKTAVASQIFHVLPIRSLRVGEDQWRYTTYYGRTLPSPINAILGRRWELSSGSLKPYDTDVEFEIPSQGISGRLAAFGDHRLHGTVMKGHAVHVIEQQLAYFSKNLKNRIDEEESDRHRAESILRRHIDALSTDALGEVADGKRDILDTTINVGSLDVPEPFRCPPTFFAERATLVRRYLAQVHPDLDEDARFAEYQQMASPRPPELATRLLDSSLVKIATHDVERIDQYFTGTIDEARAAVSAGGFLRRTYDSLYQALSECGAAADAKELNEAWVEFASIVSGKTTLESLKNAASESKIATLKNTTWGPSILRLGVQWQRIQRLPWTWLSAWLDTYKASAAGPRRSLTGPPDVCNSEAVVSGTLPKPHAGSKRVQLKNVGLWLPYNIISRPTFEDGSHVLDAWFTEKCDRWAQLALVYPATNETPQRVAIAHRVGTENSWEWIDASSRLWAVFLSPVKTDKPRSPCSLTSESLVVILRTWVAP